MDLYVAGARLPIIALYDHGGIWGDDMNTMAAGSFKAKCSAVMDKVQAKRETVMITKRSKPVGSLSRVLPNLAPDEFKESGGAKTTKK